MSCLGQSPRWTIQTSELERLEVAQRRLMGRSTPRRHSSAARVVPQTSGVRRRVYPSLSYKYATQLLIVATSSVRFRRSDVYLK